MKAAMVSKRIRGSNAEEVTRIHFSILLTKKAKENLDFYFTQCRVSSV